MKAHEVVFAETFADGIDAHHAHHGGVERIDTLVGRARSVSRTSAIGHKLSDKAIAATAQIIEAMRIVCDVGVHLHGDINAVESAFGNQLLLAAEITQVTLFTQAVAEVNFDILFSRNSKEHQVAVEFVHDAGVLKGHADGEHIGKLHVVTAAVRRPGFGIGMRMVAADDGVKFAQKRHRLLALLALHAGANTRDAPAGFARQAELFKLCLDFVGCLRFLKAQFGFGKNAFGYSLDVGTTRTNGFAHAALEIFLTHDVSKRKSSTKKASPSDGAQAAGARLRITRRQNTPSRPNMISARTVAQMKLPAATANATGMIRQESALKASMSLPTERPA